MPKTPRPPLVNQIKRDCAKEKRKGRALRKEETMMKVGSANDGDAG